MACVRGVPPSTVAYALTTLGAVLLSSVFGSLYVTVFAKHWGITEGWFQTSQILFGVWNAINDPLASWIQDRPGSAQDNKKAYASAILYGGPLFGLAFILPWLPMGDWLAPYLWGGRDAAVGIHCCLSLALFDGVFTYVVLAQCGLFAELESSQEGRSLVLAASHAATAVGSAAMFVAYPLLPAALRAPTDAAGGSSTIAPASGGWMPGFVGFAVVNAVVATACFTATGLMVLRGGKRVLPAGEPDVEEAGADTGRAGRSGRNRVGKAVVAHVSVSGDDAQEPGSDHAAIAAAAAEGDEENEEDGRFHGRIDSGSDEERVGGSRKRSQAAAADGAGKGTEPSASPTGCCAELASVLRTWWSILQSRAFVLFVACNFLQVFDNTFSSALHAAAMPAVFRGAFSAGTVGALLGAGAVIAPFLALSLTPVLLRAGHSYPMIRAAFAVKVLLAASAGIFSMGSLPAVAPSVDGAAGGGGGWGHWGVAGFMVMHRALGAVTFGWFAMAVSDIIDDDKRRHCRTRGLATSVFGLNAMIVKPAESLAPMLFAPILHDFAVAAAADVAGSVGQSSAFSGAVSGWWSSLLWVLGDATPMDGQVSPGDRALVAWRLVWGVPVACGLLQLALWSAYPLRGQQRDAGEADQGGPTSSALPRRVSPGSAAVALSQLSDANASEFEVL